MRSLLLAVGIAAIGAVGCSAETASEDTGASDDALSSSARVTCESNDNHYASCPTQGLSIQSVRVVRQLSTARCQEGVSYGKGPNYLWVNFGCRAEFEVVVDVGQPAGRIRVLDATYGGNAGARHGNATADLGRSCNGRASCDYVVSVGSLGDPVVGIQKDFDATWTCDDGSRPRQAHVNPEANGRRISLSCRGSQPPPPSAGCGTISAGQSLVQGQGLSSCDGRTSFVHQGDGNVVVYHDGQAIASTGVFDSSSDRLTLQGDGNLVQYSRFGQAIWASNTTGHDAARLVVQDDCDVALFDRGGHLYWHTNTSGCFEHH